MDEVATAFRPGHHDAIGPRVEDPRLASDQILSHEPVDRPALVLVRLRHFGLAQPRRQQRRDRRPESQRDQESQSDPPAFQPAPHRRVRTPGPTNAAVRLLPVEPLYKTHLPLLQSRSRKKSVEGSALDRRANYRGHQTPLRTRHLRPDDHRGSGRRDGHDSHGEDDPGGSWARAPLADRSCARRSRVATPAGPRLRGPLPSTCSPGLRERRRGQRFHRCRTGPRRCSFHSPCRDRPSGHRRSPHRQPR